MKKVIIAILFTQVAFSCNNLTQKEKELKANMNKPIHLENFETAQKENNILPFEELKQNHGYLSVVYLQNSCSPCYPKFIRWQQKLDSINIMYF